MYRLHQNHKPHTKMGLIIAAAILMTGAMYGLSLLGWVQLNNAVRLVQAKAPAAVRQPATEDQLTGSSVLPITELAAEKEKSALPAQTQPTPPAVIPASPNASEVAVAATSCAAQKQEAKTAHDNAVQAENKRYSTKKNKIADDYSAKGRAFSYSQKKAQKAESERHSKALKELDASYQNALKQLAC